VMSTFGKDWSHRNSFCVVIRHLEIFQVAYFRNKDKVHTIRGEVSKLLVVCAVIVLECSMPLKPEPSSGHSVANFLHPSTPVVPFVRFDTLVLSKWYVCSGIILRASVVGLYEFQF